MLHGGYSPMRPTMGMDGTSGYLNRPEQWRNFDPDLFDILVGVVSLVRGTCGHWRRLTPPRSHLRGRGHPVPWVARSAAAGTPRMVRQDGRQPTEDDLFFVDPDNGLEPAGYSHGSAKAGKSVLLSELRELARPGRCLIVYHHHSRRKGGHQCEIMYRAERLRAAGFATVDALRAKP